MGVLEIAEKIKEKEKHIKKLKGKMLTNLDRGSDNVLFESFEVEAEKKLYRKICEDILEDLKSYTMKGELGDKTLILTRLKNDLNSGLKLMREHERTNL